MNKFIGVKVIQGIDEKRLMMELLISVLIRMELRKLRPKRNIMKVYY